ncbi:conserved hypothetical protein [Luminiphilus syltensis NOR5-1B]|uniref:UPF0125 protein NOR51B_447 n=1 Tax=Luminiphilus syltensis NOR5-1B TaxID=565045 RepID=B8KWU1_9GAMM|nr:RnfH family protein [Luminiphilus syltensis]EED34510.1 conserved hypothetical protein [Luminiphilus syltensis NOR5-1B]
MTGTIRVEVAYALPDKQHIASVEVEAGTTALEAAMRAGLESVFEDLVIDDSVKLGIFGKAVPQDHVMQAGERVEIYRPLKIDPKEVRKARAAKAKAQQG